MKHSDHNDFLQHSVQQITMQPELTSQELGHLQQLLATHSNSGSNPAEPKPAKPDNSSQTNLGTNRWYLAVAASIALFIAASVWFYPDAQDSWQGSDDWARLVAQADGQVASNHVQRKPMEVQTNSFAALVDYFSMLNFKLLEPVDLTENGVWEIVGGRYTNILGHDAAQLIMRETATGVEQSLYQAKLTAEQAAAAPEMGTTIASVDGVQMKFWVDDGVLCAMTIN